MYPRRQIEEKKFPFLRKFAATFNKQLEQFDLHSTINMNSFESNNSGEILLKEEIMLKGFQAKIALNGSLNKTEQIESSPPCAQNARGIRRRTYLEVSFFGKCPTELNFEY